MQALLIKTFVRIIAYLPLSLAHAIGTLLGLGFYWLPTRLRHVSEVNIALCWPQWHSDQRQALVKASLIQTGRSLMEIGAISCWPGPRVAALVRSMEGEQYLRQALELERGVILLTPHLGCWEVGGLYLASRYPATFLYKPPKLQSLDLWLKRARQRTGAILVATNRQGTRSLLQALSRQHRLVALLPDQEPRQGTGVFSPFFGIDANTMTLAVKLAQKTGAPILFSFNERLPRARGYKLHILPAPKEIYDADVDVAVAAMNRGIEQCIRLAPEQYQWSYKRFRQQPAGLPSPYERNAQGEQN